jgi:hypothetical protein
MHDNEALQRTIIVFVGVLFQGLRCKVAQRSLLEVMLRIRYLRHYPLPVQSAHIP